MPSFPLGDSTGKFLLTVLGLVLFYKLAGTVLREYILVPRLTILADIPFVGKPRKSGRFPGRAIVCGGSIGGLLAAAMCSDHFESVVLIEPEVWANEHGHEIPSTRERRLANGVQVPVSRRTRIMQYFILHGHQPPVWVVLQQLFPTFQEALDHFGYQPAVMRMRFRYGGVYTEDPYTTSDTRSGAPLTLPITREAIETLIRYLVKTSKPNVQFRTGTVTGLTTSSTNPDSIEYVNVRYQTGDMDNATGPTQAGFSRWLKSAGFPMSPDLRVQYDPQLQYTTSAWHIPKHVQTKWPVPWGYGPGIIFGMQPDVFTGERRVLLLGIVEDDQMQITTGGWGMPGHVHSIEDVRAYTKDLNGSHLIPSWVWELFDLLELHQDECNPYHADASVGPLSWIKYHKAHLPKNFVAIGDSNMKLNPVYGQGITKIAMDVTTLDSVLRATPLWGGSMASISSRFYSKLVPRLEGLWDGTRAMDYGWDTTIPTKGETLQHGAFLRKFAWHTIMLGRKDLEIHSAWWHINMQLAPATDFFAPWFLFRMMKAAIFS